MKKLYRLSAVVISFAVAVIMPFTVSADVDDYEDIPYVDSEFDFEGSDDYRDYFDSFTYMEPEYEITKYNINVVVNEDNSFDVTEDITAYFNTQKHGIYRYIPIVNNVERTDGTINSVQTRVKNISSDMPIYDKYIDGNNYVIMFGSEDIVLTGAQDYHISYTYDIGKDWVEGADELYYNLIGTGWDTTISNVTFNIEMPKDFDSSKIGFSTGEYGAEGTDIVDFSVNDNTIKGRLTDDLSAYQGFTIRIELEDNYFTFNRLAYYGRYIAMFVISLSALAVVIFMWVKYGRDKKIIQVVEFYPPENMNCAEISYWHNGVVTPDDTVPMLIELANEGYLTIQETTAKQRGLFKNDNGYKLIYRKAYEGSDNLKRRFFNGLFKNGKRMEVDENDLKNSFYLTINEIISQIQEKNRTKVFSGRSLKLRLIAWVGCVIAIVADVMIYLNTTYGTVQDFKALLIAVAIAGLAFILAFFIRQRTDKGHEIKQKIEGFKLFLETAEKDRLEALVEENPSYFYDILPYAYVLGVSDKWVKKFSGIAMSPPQWYYSPHRTMWDYMMFSHFMNDTMASATKTFVSTPQSSSGSSSGSFGGGSFGGGGGFAGGGFGGGGGGSW